MNIDPNAPAYPVVHAIVPQPGHFTTTPPAQPGLTIRAELAARMMASLLVKEDLRDSDPRNIALNAIACADSLVAELNRPLA